MAEHDTPTRDQVLDGLAGDPVEGGPVVRTTLRSPPAWITPVRFARFPEHELAWPARRTGPAPASAGP